MAWTQADIDALDAAIKSGHTEVSFRDRTVKYRSINEMMKIRRIMANSVTSKSLNDKASYAKTSKGLDS